MATGGVQVDCHYKLPASSYKLRAGESMYCSTAQPTWQLHTWWMGRGLGPSGVWWALALPRTGLTLQYLKRHCTPEDEHEKQS